MTWGYKSHQQFSNSQYEAFAVTVQRSPACTNQRDQSCDDELRLAVAGLPMESQICTRCDRPAHPLSLPLAPAAAFGVFRCFSVNFGVRSGVFSITEITDFTEKS